MILNKVEVSKLNEAEAEAEAENVNGGGSFTIIVAILMTAAWCLRNHGGDAKQHNSETPGENGCC